MRKMTKGGVTIKMWDLGGQVGGLNVMLQMRLLHRPRVAARPRGQVLQEKYPSTRTAYPARSRPHLPGWNWVTTAVCQTSGQLTRAHLTPRIVAFVAYAAPAPVPRQARFRSLWERYCRGVQAVVFVVDAADVDSVPAAARELHSLLEKPSLKVGRRGMGAAWGGVAWGRAVAAQPRGCGVDCGRGTC